MLKFKDAEWGHGFMLYAAGESWRLCENETQLDGWLAAARGHVTGELGQEGEPLAELLKDMVELLKTLKGEKE
jgi:hypothetical protein